MPVGCYKNKIDDSTYAIIKSKANYQRYLSRFWIQRIFQRSRISMRYSYFRRFNIFRSFTVFQKSFKNLMIILIFLGYILLIIIIYYKKLFKNNDKKYNKMKLNMQKNQKSCLKQKIKNYLLNDYGFLQDYLIMDTTTLYQQNSVEQNVQVFIAQIVGTQQLVRFRKTLFNQDLLQRFAVLVQLYEQGAILADNIFILQEGQKLYFYVIQAYFPDQMPVYLYGTQQFSSNQTKNKNRTGSKNKCKWDESHQNLSDLSQIFPKNNGTRYVTLKQWINSQQHQYRSFQCKAKMIDKLKILVDCVHQYSQTYAGLTSNHIIVDIEQQQNIYLAPFNLNPQIFSQNRQVSAYIAPQILKLQIDIQNRDDCTQKMAKQLRMNSDMLKKNDIWAFGCIVLQILFYCSPVFYSLNPKNQLKQIYTFLTFGNQTKRQRCIQSQQQTLKKCISMINMMRTQSNEVNEEDNKSQLISKLILNSLQTNQQKRVLSSQRNAQNMHKQKLNLNAVKKQQQNSLTNNNKFVLEIKQSKVAYIEISNKKLLQENPKYNSQLILQFICLSNIQINKQLRINVYLQKKHSLFVSASNQSNRSIYSINKTIKFANNFDILQKLLQTPITVQIVQNDRSNKIYVNLSTLVMIVDGKRAWLKPIIGSYGVKNNGFHKDAIIKIKSTLVSNVEFIEPIQNVNIKQNIKIQQKNKPQTQQVNKAKINLQANKQNNQKCEENKKKDNKQVIIQKKNYFDIINQNLDQICQKWNHKKPMQQTNLNIKQQKTSTQIKTQQIQSPVLKNRKKIENKSPNSSCNDFSISSRNKQKDNQDQRIQQKIKQMINKFKLKAI